MKLKLNPYTLISRNQNTYYFIFQKHEDSLVYVFTKEQEDAFSKLIQGETFDYDWLCELFSEPMIDTMINKYILCQKELDTSSLTSRTDAFFHAFQMPDARQNLEHRRILILGCGGIGTHIAWHMAALGLKHLTLVDFDQIEASNLNRQILFFYKDIGKSKARVLAERMAEINPQIDCCVIECKIESFQKMEEICTGQDYDLIIKAADQPSTFSVWLDAVCKKHKKAYMTGITMQNQALIGPTFLPNESEIGWSDLIDISHSPERISGIIPSLGAILYHISDELAMEAVRFLTGYGELKYKGKIVFFDLFTGEENIVGGDKEAKTITQKVSAKLVGKPVILSTLLLITLSMLGFWKSFMLIPAFIITIALPFYLFQSTESVLRCTFLFSLVFSTILFVWTVRSNIFSVMFDTTADMVFMFVILFGVCSALCVVLCGMNRLLCNVFLKRNKI